MSNADKSALFTYAWLTLAPQTARDSVQWIPEHRFHDKRKWLFDHAAPAFRIAVEIDGANHMIRYDRHGNPKAVGRHTKPADYEKLNFAAAAGWRVFRFHPETMTNDPHTCISLVLQALGYAPITD